MSLGNGNNGWPSVPTFVALAVGLVVVAFGGIALANVTTGGGAGFDVVSAGSAVQPPPPPAEQKPPAPVVVPDTAPPAVVLAKGSKAKAVSVGRRAKFSFGATEAARFICKVDGREFQPCTSPFRAPKLGAGGHTFYVQAIDTAGNPSPVATVGFRVKKHAAHKQRHG